MSTNALTPYRGAPPELPDFLRRTTSLGVVQRKEMLEMFGFETRNKYSIHTADGAEVAWCAEQGHGILASLGRQFLGHWRSFELHIFNGARQRILFAEHPFRIFFQRLSVQDGNRRPIGAIQRRFGIFTKSFDVLDAEDRVLLSVVSPFWRVWTFHFKRDGRELARVEKKWAGFLTEMFTDADRFGVTWEPSLTDVERALVMTAAIYIDLLYFENNQGTGQGSVMNLLDG